MENIENEVIETTEVTEKSIVNILDLSNGQYKVVVNDDTSVAEVAFAITVLIKIFDRDEVIKQEEMLELINRYLTLPQYKEVES